MSIFNSQHEYLLQVFSSDLSLRSNINSYQYSYAYDIGEAVVLSPPPQLLEGQNRVYIRKFLCRQYLIQQFTLSI